MNFEVGPTLFAEGLSVTPFGYSMLAIFDFFYASAMVAHLRATFMSPGYTPKLPVPEGIPLGQARTCRYCNQWKPDRTYHCRTCKRCIHRMDHHCPWINNCIGAKNQKSFCLFLLYACLCCLQVVTLMIYFLYFSPEDQNFSGGLISLLVVVSTAVIATIFLVFTTILFYIQIRGVITGQTTVEQKMKKSAKAQPILDNLKMTFGNNVFNWLNPLADSPDPNCSEILYPTSDLLKQQ